MLSVTAAGVYLASGVHTDNLAPAQAEPDPDDLLPQSGPGPDHPIGSIASAVSGDDGVRTQPPPSAADPDNAPDKQEGAQSSVNNLVSIYEGEGMPAALAYAASRGFSITGESVTLVVESAAGGAAAASAAVAAGAEVEASYGNLVQVTIPVANLETLAASPDVTYLRQPEEPVLFATSEGVSDIGAEAWHQVGLAGDGVKVAIVDPGFDGYDQRILEGELPANVTAMSFRSDGDISGSGEPHGTACAEIIYDIAPGAQIYLVNFRTDVELGNAIEYLKSEGVDVVSASWGFFSRFRGDGQGYINDMVQDAAGSGIFWANAAGNSAKSHWSGTFADADLDSWTEFTAGDETNSIYLTAGQKINIYLTWDRWPVTDQDYDLYLYRDGNPSQPVAASEGWQGGSQEPAEQISYTVPPGRSGYYWVQINSYSTNGDATFQLYATPFNLEHRVAVGSLGGQPADSPDVMTLGAVPAGMTVLEDFSSQGPTIDGRIKPDAVAPDRVSTISYGPVSFWGTSASAPHAAGAAALVKNVHPSYTPVQLRGELEGGATDLGAPDKDNLFGSGKLNLGMLPDLVPPLVTDVQPSGMVFSTDAAVSVYYQDPGSGIDASSVAITLDGASLDDCEAGTGAAVCAAYDLAAGAHIIGGSVADNQGNIASISGSFEIACGKPELSLGSPSPFWASYDDYLAGELSVTYSLCNQGVNDAAAIMMMGSLNSGGVLSLTSTPFSIGDLDADVCRETTFKYLVPVGIDVFKSIVYIEAADACGENFSFPGPYFAP